MTHRVDAHQHFWMLRRGDYGWLTPELGALYRDFAPADLKPLLEAAGIDRTVLVQAAPTVAETRYLLGLAEGNPFVAGVVGWVDLAAAETPRLLVDDLGRHPALVGIRPMLQDLEDPEWILRPDLEDAIASLVDSGLCFDALVKPQHLPALTEFLERYPRLPVVIDHGAKPDIAARAWQPWADDIARIAATTSACCKLSGLVTEAGPGQSYESLAPYLDHLLATFGPQRLMWGSDWPVLNLAGDYPGWHDAVGAWLQPLTATDRECIEGGTATRFYGLDPTTEDTPCKD